MAATTNIQKSFINVCNRCSGNGLSMTEDQNRHCFNCGHIDDILKTVVIYTDEKGNAIKTPTKVKNIRKKEYENPPLTFAEFIRRTEE